MYDIQTLFMQLHFAMYGKKHCLYKHVSQCTAKKHC